MPLFSKKALAQHTRNPSWLIRTSLIILCASVALAMIIPLVLPPERSSAVMLPENEAQTVSFLRSILHHEEASLWGSHQAARQLLSEDATALNTLLAALPENRGQTLVGPWFRASQLDRDAILNSPDFKQLLEVPSSVRYRNEFLGDLYHLAGNDEQAVEHYIAESADHPESLHSRRRVISLSRLNQDTSALSRYLKDPLYRDAFTPSERITYYAAAGDYGNTLGAAISSTLHSFRSPHLWTALFTALVWFAILMVFWVPNRSRMIASLLAFSLGIVSTALTVFMVVIQEDQYGFVYHPEAEPWQQAIYWVAGVGLREEFLKLLCFIPLSLWTVKKRSPLDALILAGLVGLGFAFQENIQYFEQSSLDSYNSWARLLTANALHFSLTGIVGFYWHHTLSRKFHQMEAFLISFIAVTAVHGAYNATISMPALADYSMLAIIILALTTYYFFDLVKIHMETTGLGQRPSPLGIFVLGCVFLACTILIASSATGTIQLALAAFAASTASMIPLCFAFISRFRDL